MGCDLFEQLIGAVAFVPSLGAGFDVDVDIDVVEVNPRDKIRRFGLFVQMVLLLQL